MFSFKFHPCSFLVSQNSYFYRPLKKGYIYSIQIDEEFFAFNFTSPFYFNFFLRKSTFAGKF